MAEPPPPPPVPSNPPPGWYPDPEATGGYRWWDGSSWTDQPGEPGVPRGPSWADQPGEHGASPTDQPGQHRLPFSDQPGQQGMPQGPPPPLPGVGPPPFAVPPAPSSKGPLGDFGPWFSESFRLAVDRSGHFLPMVVVFVLSIGLLNAFALWFGLEDSTLTIDSQTGAVEGTYGGSRGWLMLAGLSIPVSAVLTALAKASITRQAWAAQRGAPEPWSDSVNGAMARSRRVILVALGRTLIYWAAALVLVLAVVVNPAFTLLGPVVALGLFGVWVGLSFIGTTAALAGPEHGAYRTSLGLARVQLGGLIGRLLVLALVAGSMIVAFGLLGAPLTALAGGGSETTVEFGSDTFRSQDVLGNNVVVFALGSVFSALGLGANYVLTTVGTTLLYRNLMGPVGADRPGREAEGVVGFPGQ